MIERLIKENNLEQKKNRNGTIYYEQSGELIIKQCTKCKEIKHVSDFRKNKCNFKGIQANCKACMVQRSKESKQDTSKRKAIYYLDNRQRIRNEHRDYYRKNSERIKSLQAKYRIKNIEVIKERDARYRKENTDKISRTLAKYYKENKVKFRLYELRRRARKRELPNELFKQDFDLILQEFNHSCALSGVKEGIHFDHVIPLATGHGGTTFKNIIPLRGDLNTSKGDSNIFEWFEANRQRFELSQKKFDRLIGFLAEANEMTIEEYRDYVYWCHENRREIGIQ